MSFKIIGLLTLFHDTEGFFSEWKGWAIALASAFHVGELRFMM